MIRTLVITGANNHDWRRSAPFCKVLLESTGTFTVDLTENPAKFFADPSALGPYQLFLLDYNGPDWGDAARKNFEAAVAGGTGLCVLHAANNMKSWPELEKMAGLLWREGTGHGGYHEFQVAIVDHDHPITRGLADFMLWDELYHRLVNVQNVPYRVLAAAYDDPSIMGPRRGGSGRHEPVIVVLQYGRGRVYHHVLGHVWPPDPTVEDNDSAELPSNFRASLGGSMKNFETPEFQQILVRGCEWAATGEVSSP